METQIVDGKEVYVYDVPQWLIDNPEKLPLENRTSKARILLRAIEARNAALPMFQNIELPNETALKSAIRAGYITEPGQYAIEIIEAESRYECYKVNSPEEPTSF